MKVGEVVDERERVGREEDQPAVGEAVKLDERARHGLGHASDHAAVGQGQCGGPVGSGVRYEQPFAVGRGGDVAGSQQAGDDRLGGAAADVHDPAAPGDVGGREHAATERRHAADAGERHDIADLLVRQRDSEHATGLGHGKGGAWPGHRTRRRGLTEALARRRRQIVEGSVGIVGADRRHRAVLAGDQQSLAVGTQRDPTRRAREGGMPAHIAGSRVDRGEAGRLRHPDHPPIVVWDRSGGVLQRCQLGNQGTALPSIVRISAPYRLAQRAAPAPI